MAERIDVLEARLAGRNPSALAVRAGWGRAHQLVAVGNLVIDHDARRVTVGGREMPLSPLEYRVLYHLARNSGAVVEHRTLLRDAWGRAYAGQRHYVNVYAARLRRKLRAHAAACALETVRGLGYRLVAKGAGAPGACDGARP